MSVIESVCLPRGHNIISQPIKEIIDPVFKVTVKIYEYRCTQCGKTLEECEKFRLSAGGKRRQGKANANDRNSRARSGGTEANTEAAKPESTDGAEHPVSQQAVPASADTPSGS